ncbi:uncharacterized protein LTR77_003894 [Saxophila tyrrhenica]|uniref:Uncharacterized protein n=1 Tax=Saxophila tyrrhenica TaxID=1690608 RepID=A0AAV9PHX3_9PEZI|nr:hypothetical protein LTR77_003894 [Saxophila tyrrhenica]
MQVAEILSDLMSLQVCDPNAALVLVSARPEGTIKDEQKRSEGGAQDDPDLKRAKDLLHLHSTVKLAHQDGTDRELNEAREAVEKVLRAL